MARPSLRRELLRSCAAEALAAGASLAVVPLVRDTGKPVKANLSIDAGVLSAIDEEAARRKLTRSALVEFDGPAHAGRDLMR